MTNNIPASHLALSWLERNPGRTDGDASLLFGVSREAISQARRRRGGTRVPSTERARTERAIRAERDACAEVCRSLAAHMPDNEAQALQAAAAAIMLRDRIDVAGTHINHIKEK